MWPHRVFPKILPELFGKLPEWGGLRVGTTPSSCDVHPEVASPSRSPPVVATNAPSWSTEEPGTPEREPLEVRGESHLWLQVAVAGFRLRVLYDMGASSDLMGPSGLRLAAAAGRELIPGSGRKARIPGKNRLTIAGYVNLPFFEFDSRPMPTLIGAPLCL